MIEAETVEAAIAIMRENAERNHGFDLILTHYGWVEEQKQSFACALMSEMRKLCLESLPPRYSPSLLYTRRFTGHVGELALVPVVIFGKQNEHLAYRKSRILQYGAVNYAHTFSQLIQTMCDTLEETATVTERNNADESKFH